MKDSSEIQKSPHDEIIDCWLGPMPVDEFLQEFLRPVDAPLPNLQDPFKEVLNDGIESIPSEPFITAIQEWMPDLRVVNTSNKEDIEGEMELTTGISVYNRDEGVEPATKTDFSRIELWINFKTNRDGVAFRDPTSNSEESRHLAIKKRSFVPHTADGISAREQLAHCASVQHIKQFRHFSFSVLVDGDHARFLRWDPSGMVVTAAFNYRTSPRLMADFFWRFNHLSAEERGHDVSIAPANLPPEVDARVRKKLSIRNKNIPLYRYTIPGLIEKGHAYGPRPKTENQSLVSRVTRNLPVVWIPVGTRLCTEPGSESLGELDATSVQGDAIKIDPWHEERSVYLKDTWRYLSDRPGVEGMPEHKVYEKLHRYNTPNIPEHVAGGDVKGGKTRTQEFDNAPWLCMDPNIFVFRHYRLVHGIVGRELFKFKCTKELVKAVFDAVQAHWHAFEVAKILHRDISVGNIILTDEGRGLLIDWELAVNVANGGSRPGRVGTWEYMSANLLRDAGKTHTFKDDLESFLHVLGWMTLCYVPAHHRYEPDDRSEDVSIYHEWCHNDMGGSRKSQVLVRGTYPSWSSIFQPETSTPLCNLLLTLSKPFKSLYAANPPTAVDRVKLLALPPDLCDSDWDSYWELVQLRQYIKQYDEDMKQLQSSAFFIAEMQKALNRNDWPTDDKASDQDLSIASDRDTNKRGGINTSWRESTHNLQEIFKEPPNLKRAASPMPLEEPSTKRRRGRAASESRGFFMS